MYCIWSFLVFSTTRRALHYKPTSLFHLQLFACYLYSASLVLMIPQSTLKYSFAIYPSTHTYTASMCSTFSPTHHSYTAQRSGANWGSVSSALWTIVLVYSSKDNYIVGCGCILKQYKIRNITILSIHIIRLRLPHTYLSMCSDVFQSCKKFLSQSFDIFQVIFHGERQVHQVVEIHWVTLNSFKRNIECGRKPCKHKIRKTCESNQFGWA